MDGSYRQLLTCTELSVMFYQSRHILFSGLCVPICVQCLFNISEINWGLGTLFNKLVFGSSTCT